MNSRRRITALLGVALAGVAATAAGSVGGSAAAELRAAPGTARAPATVVRIWTDRDRKAAVTRVATTWATRRGLTVEVVEKEFGDIRDDLKTVKSENAPDVITAAHDWTGELAASGLVVALNPRRSALRPVPQYALQAFSYGKAGAKLYGMPVALENVGLVVNTRLARVPRTFADLEQQALRFQRRGGGRVGLAVQQGSGGDAYHMYPFFSGLCGYIFGRTRGGALNPKDVGVANRRFLANASLIDRWNRMGLINAKIDGDKARELFVGNKAAFWVTGPWNIDTIAKANIRFTVVQVPAIRCQSVPFLGVQGFMVTKFASGHGVGSAAKDLVGSYMSSSGAQSSLAAANGRYPANVTAGARVRNRALAQFGRAGRGGVPMPNIPEMSAVWTDLGNAWVRSTKGRGATKARAAFRVAARNIRNKIG